MTDWQGFLLIFVFIPLVGAIIVRFVERAWGKPLTIRLDAHWEKLRELEDVVPRLKSRSDRRRDQLLEMTARLDEVEARLDELERKPSGV